MKNSRSGIWTKKKSRLEKQEELLKDELEEVSSDLETTLKRVATIAAITGGVFLVGYGLYKAFSGKKPQEETKQPAGKETPQQIKVKPTSVKSIVIEKLAVAAVQFIGARLAMILSDKLASNKDEGEGKKGTKR